MSQNLHDLCIPRVSPSELARHPDSARFHEILEEVGALHDQKQRDYGNKDAPFANLEAAKDFNISPFVGTLVRMGDKFSRLKTYVRTGKLANEGVIDNLKDIAVYAIAEIVLFEKEAADPISVKLEAEALAQGLKW